MLTIRRNPPVDDRAALRDAAHEAVRAARRSAYEAEADPLAFKVLRGEVTPETLLAKVAEIRARLPYPED